MKNSITFSVLVFSLIIFIPLFLYSQSAWVTQNSGTNNDLWYVTFINENMGYAVGEGGTIIKTTNGGNSWFPQPSNTNDTLFCVHFINENIGSIVGEDGEIRRTTNGGSNWISQTSSTSNTLRSVYFVNANTGLASGFNGTILKTTNSGNNWFPQTSNTNQNFWSVFLLNTNTGWAVGFSGTVRKTTNEGLNWFSQSVNNNTAQLLYVSFLNANTGIITVGIPGNVDIYTTSNGGNSWQPRDFTSGHSHRSVDIIDSNIWMMVGDAGDFYRSTNGGLNWNFHPLGISNWLLSTSFINANTGWVVGTSGIILKTTTGGATLPLPPVLTSPPNNTVNISVTPTLVWNTSQGAVKYHVQISTVANFQVITDSITLSSTQYQVPAGKLINGYTYFWRVNASNSAGTSTWSSIWNFTTSISPPVTPVLISPPNGSQVTTTPLLDWNDVVLATSYRLQVSQVSNFMTTVIDEVSLTTSQYQVPSGVLSANVQYFWRARARNAGGWSPWASAWNFTTSLIGVNPISGEIPTSFNLYQNYPNPFNPLTNIRFDIPKSSFVKIILYDVLGNVITTIVNEKLSAGSYEVNWDASDYPSGVYIYKLHSSDFVDVKKMVLIK